MGILLAPLLRSLGGQRAAKDGLGPVQRSKKLKKNNTQENTQIEVWTYPRYFFRSDGKIGEGFHGSNHLILIGAEEISGKS